MSLTLLAAAAATAMCPVTLTGANVWTGSKYEKRDVKIGAGTTSVDGSRLFLLPPLVDAHTHTIDTPRAGPTGADAVHDRMLRLGILYALNPNNIRPAGPTPAAKPTEVALQAAGGGVTGPGGHPRPLYTFLARQGFLGPGVTVESLPGKAFHEAATPAEARAGVRAVKANGASVVKLYLLDHQGDRSQGLSGEAFDAAVDEAKKQKLRPLVHVESRDDFARAVKAGVAGIVHTPYALRADMPREMRLIAAADAQAAAEAGIVVVPTLTAGTSRLSGARLAAMMELQRANLVTLRDAGVKLAVGADNYALGMLDELTLLRVTGLFEADALIQMVTENGMQLAHGRTGSLTAPGAATMIGYFVDPTGDWSSIGSPVLAMRDGQLILDDAFLLTKACGPAALKSKWAP